MAKQTLVLFLALVVGAHASCSSADSKEVCFVTAEDGRTCSWCIGPNNLGACANSTAAEDLKARGSTFTCDNGDDLVLTRAVELPPRAQAAVGAYSDDYIPVVFMHGLGDAGHNPGMQSIAKSVMETYPGSYSVSVDVADGISSYTELIAKQVAEFAAKVQSDPKLARGFNAAGLSQGGLIVRAYVELYNNPPVFTLMSLCGPQEGVGDCPGGTPEFLCNMVREALYEAPISFAGYWKNSLDKAKYLTNNKDLVFWNNERDDSRNATYKQQMLSLDKYVLIQALNDTVVKPHESENHQYFAWGSDTEKEITGFTDMEGYQGDWIGLQTLDSQGKIFHHSYVGNHLRWSQEFWYDTVLPYFNQTFTQLRSRQAQQFDSLLVSQASA